MLYTRKGDQGTTKLYGCTGRIAKDDARIAALGALDELNSWLGLCAALITACAEDLRSMQEDVFVIQAQLAGAPKHLAVSRVEFLEECVAKVEKEIPPIHSFTIPGATGEAGYLDVARTVVRRAERSVVAVHDPSLDNVIPYLNRLSSALFALARSVVHRAVVKERTPSY